VIDADFHQRRMVGSKSESGFDQHRDEFPGDLEADCKPKATDVPACRSRQPANGEGNLPPRDSTLLESKVGQDPMAPFAFAGHARPTPVAVDSPHLRFPVVWLAATVEFEPGKPPE